MATSQGIVTKVGPGKAWVKSQRSHACKACSARSTCNPTDCDDSDVEVEAINLAGAKSGDRVVIAFEDTSLIKISFFLYIIPIIALLAGAIAGQQFAPLVSMDPSLFSAGMGFIFFIISIFFITIRGRGMSKRTEYIPKITRVVQRGL